MKETPNHEFYMEEALKEAKKAFSCGEVPVGAVVVKDGEIIARGHNERERKNDISSHAEIEAIKMAEKTLGRWSLEGCSLYVTIEPCLMCSGAIKQAKISSVFYGADDPSVGAVKTHYHVYDDPSIEYNPLVYSGILEKECAELMRLFFAEKRKNKGDI